MALKAQHREVRVAVVGAGFAGASFVRNLSPSLRRPGETLLIDRDTQHPFVPLIHEVAAGRVHPESVTSSIPALCRGRCGFLRAEVTGMDLSRKILETSSGEVGYEYLLFTPGSVGALPPESLRESFGLFWTLEDALKLRADLAGEWRAATSPGTEADPGELTVAIAGGGSTGVELAAEVSSLFDYLGRRASRAPGSEPRVVLLEATERLMGWLDPYFHEVAMEELARLGVEVRLNTPVEAADAQAVQAGDERLPARVRIWAGGIDFPPLVKSLPGGRDSAGRLRVDDHLTLPEHPEVYLPGDAGVHEDPEHGPLPPTASVAVQQGPFAARDLARRIRGSHRRPFQFFNRGYVVSLGPESAVAEAAGRRLRGAAAQTLYRSIFLYNMGRRERILTGADWAMERALGRLGFKDSDGVDSEKSHPVKPSG